MATKINLNIVLVLLALVAPWVVFPPNDATWWQPLLCIALNIATSLSIEAKGLNPKGSLLSRCFNGGLGLVGAWAIPIQTQFDSVFFNALAGAATLAIALALFQPR